MENERLHNQIEFGFHYASRPGRLYLLDDRHVDVFWSYSREIDTTDVGRGVLR